LQAFDSNYAITDKDLKIDFSKAISTNPEKNEVFLVKLELSQRALEAHADTRSIPVQWKPEEVENKIKSKKLPHITAAENANEDPSYYSPFDYIYAGYDIKLNHELVYPDLGFNDQLRLLEDVLSLDELVASTLLDSFFALHDKDFEDGSLNFPSYVWESVAEDKGGDVFDNIREYYGEQIAFYFRFVTHFQRWLVPLGVLGLAVQVLSCGYI